MKLPPLACLRAFEAAVRTGGFARAADELALTPNAVAHQVKQLEEWLDMRLFERHARGVVPTPAGSAYAAAVADTFEQLSAATRQLLVRRDDRVVTVTAMPSLVTRWLMPRLPRLAVRHPDIEVRVLASVKHVDLFHGEADVAIRLGRGPYPGLASEELLIENFVAVASPRFLEAHPNLATPADLFRLPLLHDEMIDALPDEVDWPKWFEAVGVKPPRRLAGHLFSHTYLTLEAAIAGQGVALAGEHFLGDAITGGRLRVLFNGLSVKGPYQYHLLRLPGAEVRPAVAAVCDWVREETRAG